MTCVFRFWVKNILIIHLYVPLIGSNFVSFPVQIALYVNWVFKSEKDLTFF